MIKLSIIIVSYNTKSFVIDCIKSILETTKKISYEIIVIDNASRDGTIEAIQNSKFKIQNYNSKLKIVENKQNYGFSRANNIGVKNSKGRYLLFLNPDTVVYPGTIETMVEFMEKKKDAGAATCKIILPNGKIDDASHRGFPTPWNAFSYFLGLSKLFPSLRLFSGYTMGWEDFSQTHKIDALAGAFMIVRRRAGEGIGWWDEDYFWYGDDIDFCYRLKEKGWKIYYFPYVSILHYKGVSGGIKNVSSKITTASKETREKAMISRFDAMRIFYKKHYDKKYPRLVNFLVIQGISLKSRLAKFML